MNGKLESLEIQTDSDNRPYRMQGTRKNGALPSKWINKTEHFHWIYDFRYLDEKGGNIQIEIDYNDNIIRVEKMDVYGNIYYSKKK